MKRYLSSLFLTSLALLSALLPLSAGAQTSPTLTIYSNGDLSFSFSGSYINYSGNSGVGITIFNGADNTAPQIASYFAYNDYSTGGVPSPLTISAADGSLNWTPRTQDPQFYSYTPYVPANITSGYITICIQGGGQPTQCATSATSITIPSPQISFHTPTLGYAGSDFPYWYLAGYNLSTTTLYRFDVLYSLAGGSVSYDDFNLSDSVSTNALLQIAKTEALSNGTGWTAQGFLFATSTTNPILAAMYPGDAIATTSVIQFSINTSSSTGAGVPIFGGGAPTSTVGACGTAPPFFELVDVLPYFQLDSPDPIIAHAICVTLSGLFQMSDTQSAQINSVYQHAASTIAVKAPFGYFTIATGALSSFTNGSSTVSLLSSDGATALSPIFSPIDFGLAAAISLLSLFWLLRRIKHIQP
jgi:hypothetical protein